LPDGKGAEEARVVGAYLRRRGTDARAVRLSSAVDLVDAVEKVAERFTDGFSEAEGTLEA
jgi:phosphohistidine phosphatase SixA